MKTLKFKSTAAGAGYCTAQNPLAPLGQSSTCLTYEVTEIPDEMAPSAVAQLLTNTCTFLAERKGRYSFKFSELGEGVILQA